MLLSDIPAIAAHHAADAIALRIEDRAISYRELRDRCWRLSNALLQVGKPGDRVAILSENCAEYIDCYYGVPGAGMALTMLNYRLAPRELAYIIGNSEPRILVVEAKYLPTIRQIRAEIPSVERILIIGEEGQDCESYNSFMATGAATEPTQRPAEEALCWLLYTSGTTGLPKGAMLSHRNLMAGIMNNLVTWDAIPNESHLFTFPLYHVAGYVTGSTLLRNAPVMLLRSFDPETLLRNVEAYGITNTAMAPTMIGMLLENPAMMNKYNLSSLRKIGYGGSAMPVEILRRARTRWPQIRFSTGFGMTEIAGNSTQLNAADHDRAAEQGLDILRSVGKEMLLTRTRVIDEQGRDVAVNVPGEMVIKGDQVLTGYWRNPEATEKSFIDGWFRTGDVGQWDEDRYLYVVDRKKDMILTGGENVYPREVEEVIYQHPAVVEAAVVGIPDPIWGEKVVAVVCVRAGHSLTEAELIAFCREHIASYKKPRHVLFIEALPRNASGKVLKHQLRSRIADGDLPLPLQKA